MRQYRDILLGRAGPEDLPVSAALLVWTVIAQVALSLLVLATVPDAGKHALPMVGLEVVITLLWGNVLLRAAGRPERFRQMMSAVFGIKVLVQLLVWPAAWIVGTYPRESSISSFAAVLAYAVGIWGLIATARITRSATGWPLLLCVVVAFLQELAMLLVAVALFPDLLDALKDLPASAT